MARQVKSVPLTTSQVANKLASRGYHVIPLAPGQKAAVDRHWTKLRLSVEQVDEKWDENPEYGVGLLLGTEVAPSVFIMAVDIDVEDDLLFDRIRAVLPGAAPSKKGAKGLTLICQTDRSLKKQQFKRQKEAKAAVEVLASGQQTVLPPSIHPDGMQYTWMNGALQDYDPQELPLLSLDAIKEIEVAVRHPDAKMFLINVWEPGGMHNAGVEAVASLVAFGMSDAYIVERVIRAMQIADLKHGFDGRDYEHERNNVREWVKSSRSKEFGKKKEGKGVQVDVIHCQWLRDEWRGPGTFFARGSQLLAYSNGYFEAMSPEQFYRVLASCGNDDIEGMGSRGWRLITDTAISIAPQFPEVRSHRVCFNNGTYDMDTSEVLPWSKDDYLISHLDFDYDPDAVCLVYDKFMKETFANSEDEEACQLGIDTFEEYVSMTMFECHDYQRFMVLEGVTRSGKSVLTSIAAMMHHSDSISAVMAHDFGNERSRTSMLGRLINITGETSTVSTVADDYLKLIVAGERVDVRHLYHGTFPVNLPTRFLIATNEPLKTKDTSGAVMERMIVLKCMNYVPDNKRDIQLSAKLKAERSGIFNRMARAWLRLSQRGLFKPPASSIEAATQFERDNNPVMQWLEENTHQGRMISDPSYQLQLPEGMVDYTQVSLLYLNFTEWAKMRGYMQMNIITFSSKLSSIRHPRVRTEAARKFVGGVAVRVRHLTLSNVKY